MLTALIIDDEQKARSNLENLLKDYCPNVEVAAKAGTVSEAMNAIGIYQPDFIFLDVRMQGETGFDLLKQIDNPSFDVIFTTAYNEYALKAFRFCAVDYLLKPLNIDELKEAVKKVEEKHSSQFKKERLELFLQGLKDSGNAFSKIALPTMEGLNFVKIQDIIRCESDENYTNFHLTTDEKILVSKTIKYFDELLQDHNFFRTHRSHLINLNHIKKYVKGDGGYAIMSDGCQVVVSRRKKDDFLQKLAS
ncbi:MAG: DNA-binding response regulator [Flavobacteriales bacterium]|nr:MAG: DNA-binding response regulator [Flavobacteriales bacterium]